MLPTIFPVTSHTKYVGHGSTFVTIKGYHSDGHDYIVQAIKQGAGTIICQSGFQTEELEKKYSHVKFEHVDNTRAELAIRAADALNRPADKLTIIGITGTSGKTTTSYALWHALNTLGAKAALLGTIKAQIGMQSYSSSLTTPTADELHMFFAQCVKNDATHVVMEVSSHALSLQRTYGIFFDAACFTNLSPEHLDFYHSMDDYFAAKALLFEQVKPGGYAIINTDDEWGTKLFEKLRTRAALHSIAINKKEIERHKFISPHMVGEFNTYNTTVAGRACEALGFEHSAIEHALSTFTGVPGRMEMVELGNNIKACIDYAHKSGAMEAVLATLRKEASQLIVIFGCGGNRDPYKRSVMGKIAAQYGDIIIITNDNPRYEDPHNIAQDIKSGMDDATLVYVELDRKAAIAKGVSLAQNGAIIAVLGKGHEDTMLIAGVRYQCSDREIVNALKKTRALDLATEAV